MTTRPRCPFFYCSAVSAHRIITRFFALSRVLRQLRRKYTTATCKAHSVALRRSQTQALTSTAPQMLSIKQSLIASTCKHQAVALIKPSYTNERKRLLRDICCFFANFDKSSATDDGTSKLSIFFSA